MATILFTDSICDLTPEKRKQYEIEYFRMSFTVAGEDKYADIDYVDYTPEQLYAWIGDTKNHCKTSQVSPEEFKTKMLPHLQNGDDILYIGCALPCSGSVNTFRLIAEQLKEDFPERKMIGVDSTTVGMGLGRLVMDVSDERKKGKTIEELAQWAEENKEFYHQIGTVEDLTYLRAAGRVSGSAAFFGNIIGVKPLIMCDVPGYNYAYKKVRGSKNATRGQIDYLKENMVEGVTDVVYVGQGMAQKQQEELCQIIENELHLKTEKYWVGPIIGVSCGPGTAILYFKGKKITLDSTKKE